jgi:hypothetical protein
VVVVVLLTVGASGQVEDAPISEGAGPDARQHAVARRARRAVPASHSDDGTARCPGRVEWVSSVVPPGQRGLGAAPAEGLFVSSAAPALAATLASNGRKHPTSVGLPSSLTAFEGGAMVLSFVMPVWVVCHGRFREFSLHR